MSEQKETNDRQQPTNLNTAPDDATQDDPEFNQWRRFCAVHNIDVNLLVSQLSAKQDENWQEFKRQEQAVEKASKK